jgi:hypothetical protein
MCSIWALALAIVSCRLHIRVNVLFWKEKIEIKTLN